MKHDGRQKHPYHLDLVEHIAQSLATRRRDADDWHEIDPDIQEKYREDAVIALTARDRWVGLP